MPLARLAAIAMLSLSTALTAFAQEPAKQGGAPAAKAPQVEAAPPVAKPGGAMQRFPGVWVEGPGYQITYGDTYDSCAKKCLSQTRCVMIEFYRPEKKCNLYDTVRPKLKGGSSDVAVRG
jgi:PAN domain